MPGTKQHVAVLPIVTLTLELPDRHYRAFRWLLTQRPPRFGAERHLSRNLSDTRPQRRQEALVGLDPASLVSAWHQNEAGMREPGEGGLDPLPPGISQFYIRSVQGCVVAIQKGDAGDRIAFVSVSVIENSSCLKVMSAPF